MGHELESSNNHGSTQLWWKQCLPSHGSTRTSSPSSKSTMQIGHVSRPIEAGITSGRSAAPLLLASALSEFVLRGRMMTGGIFVDEDASLSVSLASCPSTSSLGGSLSAKMEPLAFSSAAAPAVEGPPAAAASPSSLTCRDWSIRSDDLDNLSCNGYPTPPFSFWGLAPVDSISLRGWDGVSALGRFPNLTIGNVSRIARVRPLARLCPPGPPSGPRARGPYLSGCRMARIALRSIRIESHAE